MPLRPHLGEAEATGTDHHPRQERQSDEPKGHCPARGDFPHMSRRGAPDRPIQHRLLHNGALVIPLTMEFALLG